MQTGDLPPKRGQLAFDLGHNASDDEVDFMVGPGNRLAHAHVDAFPRWAAPLTLIVGPPSSGKSHLARIWLRRAGAVEARAPDVEALAAAGGDRPVLVEDVDRAGYAEPALFHLLNQSMRDRRPLLMTARLPVAEWPFRTDDVKSRARLAAAFEVRFTDEMQLSQILVKLFGDRQISVEPRVVAYLVSRMERSAEEAVILVNLVDRLALAAGTAITRAIAAEALAIRAATLEQNQMSLPLTSGGDDGEDE